MNICELFEFYKREADASYNPQFFSKDKIIKYAERAKLTEINVQLLSHFIDFADDEIKRFMWQFYYFQFCTKEDFSKNMWLLEGIPKPEDSEAKFPGCINSVVYLLAVDNLEKWISDKSVNKTEIIESYFDRYRNMAALNVVSHDTPGFCRLSPFLYGYAKPFILRVGRLNFQFTEYRDYCEMYEDNEGKRIFVALPNYTYNQDGLQEKHGFVPVYKKEQGVLTAHLFGEKGKLNCHARRIDTECLRAVLQPGDNVVTIHIPEGGKLCVEEVKASIYAADKLFKKYFPPFKAFVCQTWFLDPALRGDVIKEGSNMAAFADLFDIICGTDNENHSIYEHIFKVKKQSLENLVPQNGFQKRILDRALSGERIYWGYGVLKKNYFDDLKKEVER